MKWVRLKKAASDSGLTEKAIRENIRKGHWLMDVVWRKDPQGNIWVCPQEIDQWVEGKLFGPQAQTHQARPAG